MKNSSLNNQLSFEKQKELLTPYIKNQIPFIYNGDVVIIQDFCEYEINSDFMDKYLFERIRNLDFEFDWFYSFYLECVKTSSKAQIYESQIEALRVRQFEKIKSFFYILLVENDIKKCEDLVEDFISFFESIQVEYSKIYKNLLDIYSLN